MVAEEDFWTGVTTGERGAVEAMLRVDPRLAGSRRQGVSAILLALYHHKSTVAAALRPHVPSLDIFEAAALGDRVRALLDADPGLANAVAEDGFGPLGLASFFDREPAVRVLLERGARVDTPSFNGMRMMPLHTAADHARAQGHRALAERLESVAWS